MGDPDAAKSTYGTYIAASEVEPDQLHHTRRARVDEQHSPRTRRARPRVEHDRTGYGRLEDDAPAHRQLRTEGVGAGGHHDAADGAAERSGQAGHVADRGLESSAVAGHEVRRVHRRKCVAIVSGPDDWKNGTDCEQYECNNGVQSLVFFYNAILVRLRNGV